MATVTPLPGDWSVADLQAHLGGVPVERIRMYPAPGYATEDDRQRALAAGCHMHVRKPASPQALLDLLDQI